ncbi:MAG: hypothetical protein CMR00_04025 [[Chlorobium] sp. 445]|nr:MAG: hypothetical protein CMR00_04025 [[Chlorobium] sp. 445]
MKPCFKNAVIACEKIRASLESYYWEGISERLHVTMSFGLAESTAKKTVQQLLSTADTKLYEAKTAGRNRIAY